MYVLKSGRHEAGAGSVRPRWQLLISLLGFFFLLFFSPKIWLGEKAMTTPEEWAGLLLHFCRKDARGYICSATPAAILETEVERECFSSSPLNTHELPDGPTEAHERHSDSYRRSSTTPVFRTHDVVMQREVQRERALTLHFAPRTQLEDWVARARCHVLPSRAPGWQKMMLQRTKSRLAGKPSQPFK